MTPDEARAAGFVEIDGEWYAPNTARARAYRFARDTGTPAKLERHSGNGVLVKGQIQKPASGRFLVRVTAVRHRLLDEDNACEKYHIDCLRYSGLLPGDSPATTKIETRQEKAEPGGKEFVRIEIYRVA